MFISHFHCPAQSRPCSGVGALGGVKQGDETFDTWTASSVSRKFGGMRKLFMDELMAHSFCLTHLISVGKVPIYL